MSAVGTVRKVDDLGRVVIPKEIRRTLNLRCGADVEFLTDIDGAIILRPYLPTYACANCGDIHDLVQAENIRICKSCLTKMTK